MGSKPRKVAARENYTENEKHNEEFQMCEGVGREDKGREGNEEVDRNKETSDGSEIEREQSR